MEQEKKSQGFGIAAFVIAMVGLLICWIPVVNLLTFLNLILALIFGIIAIVKQYGRGFGIAGVTIGIVSALISYSITTTFVGFAVNGLKKFFNIHSGDYSISISGDRAEELVNDILTDSKKLLEEYGIYINESGEGSEEVEESEEVKESEQIFIPAKLELLEDEEDIEE